MQDSKFIEKILGFMSLLVLFAGCVLAMVKLDALWLLCFLAGFLAKLARIVGQTLTSEVADGE